MDSNPEEMNSVDPVNSSTLQLQNPNQDNSDTNEASTKGIIKLFSFAKIRNFFH